MLEKHIQLMHGIKDPDVKELSDDVTNEEEEEEEEVEIKEDAKVRHLSSALSWARAAECSLVSILYSHSLSRILPRTTVIPSQPFPAPNCS